MLTLLGFSIWNFGFLQFDFDFLETDFVQELRIKVPLIPDKIKQKKAKKNKEAEKKDEGDKSDEKGKDEAGQAGSHPQIPVLNIDGDCHPLTTGTVIYR